MQMEIFPMRPEAVETSTAWSGLTEDERVALIGALARLMVKAVRPEAKGGEDDE